MMTDGEIDRAVEIISNNILRFINKEEGEI